MSGSIEVQQFLQQHGAGDGMRGAYGGVPTQRSGSPEPPRISDDQVRRARLAVAQGSLDVEDCAQLLEMLGLAPTDQDRPPVQR